MRTANCKLRILKEPLYYRQLDSTNDFLKKFPLPNGSVVAAIKQKAGKGKHGAKWVSPPGGLWFSFLIKKKVKEPYMYIILVSCAIIDVLKQRGIKARIKWPNDILVKGAKLCGVLIDNDYYGGKLVVGVGMNVNNRPPKVVGMKTTSVSALLKRKVELDLFLEALLEKLDLYLSNAKLHRKAIISKWIKNQVDVKGREITIRKNGKVIEGVLKTVNKDGSILVSMKDGKEKVFKGEIFFI